MEGTTLKRSIGQVETEVKTVSKKTKVEDERLDWVDDFFNKRFDSRDVIRRALEFLIEKMGMEKLGERLGRNWVELGEMTRELYLEKKDRVILEKLLFEFKILNPKRELKKTKRDIISGVPIEIAIIIFDLAWTPAYRIDWGKVCRDWHKKFRHPRNKQLMLLKTIQNKTFTCELWTNFMLNGLILGVVRELEIDYEDEMEVSCSKCGAEEAETKTLGAIATLDYDSLRDKGQSFKLSGMNEEYEDVYGNNSLTSSSTHVILDFDDTTNLFDRVTSKEMKITFDHESENAPLRYVEVFKNMEEYSETPKYSERFHKFANNPKNLNIVKGLRLPKMLVKNVSTFCQQ